MITKMTKQMQRLAVMEVPAFSSHSDPIVKYLFIIEVPLPTGV